MREWIPVSTSPKGRLALTAVKAFGTRPFADVTVGQLATEADVTTGAIYHHFTNKLGLYAFVRHDVEQRLLDRMEGAIAAANSADDRSAALSAALVVGFDFAMDGGFLHLLAAPPVGSEVDRLADLLTSATSPAAPVLGPILAAAWRAALMAVSEGAEPEAARAALRTLHIQESH